MKKELKKVNTLLKNNQKKVDLKISNKKYALTFNQPSKNKNKSFEPIVLGVNDQSEIRIMVNTNAEMEEEIESLVEQIKESFQEYLSNMKQGEFKPRSFDDIVFKDEHSLQEYVVKVDIMKDRLLIMHDEIIEIKFQDINDIYVERKSDLSKSTRSEKENAMKYVLLYNNWIMIEANQHVYAFSGTRVEYMFSTLSQAFFMSQMKQNR